MSENIAVRKFRELEPGAQRWVRSVLGRELEPEEEVAVMAFPPHPAPEESVRRAAIGRMESFLDEAAEKLKDVPADELEAAVDEAMDHVRRRDS